MLVLLMVEDMLTDLGCEAVSAAATVKQALALIAAQNFDAAMLDMNLDGEETFAVADALAARGVPFAFVTGYGSRDMREGYGDRPLLKKPFSFEDLAAIAARLLARRSSV